MFKTARTTARTALMAASTAGFVALGAGIAGADTLGGVTDGLPLGDLGSQVPAQLTEGVTSPVGDLAKVEPGTISATPEIDHQSNPVDTVGGVVGEGAPVHAPIGDEDNAANVGPLDLESVEGAVPLANEAAAPASGDPISDLLGGDVVSGLVGQDLVGQAVTGQNTVPQAGGAVDPLSGLLGGDLTSLLGGAGPLEGVGSGGTLPLAHPVSAPEAPALVDQAPALVDEAPAAVGEVVPMAGTDTPVSLDPGENADLTGGATTLLPAAGLPEPTEVLPMAAPEVASLTDLAPADSVGGDLVGVEGLPRVGEPQVDPAQVTGLVTGDLA
ncbi:hypothetical protein [Nocardiopsis lucentensis]|uniref:hypothetical protein n=1 Tax=Nocardiopsis lucentensis TaxID=53441 RepID=UPI000347C6C5|nr:hypothetical protein [Nocardiopsis lucentensis]